MKSPSPGSLFIHGMLLLATYASAIRVDDDALESVPGTVSMSLGFSHNDNAGGLTINKRQVGVSLHRDLLKRQYNVEISIGSPRQTLLLPLDMASDVLWVKEKPTSQPGTTGFDIKKSATLKPLNYHWQMKYPQNDCAIIRFDSYRDNATVGSIIVKDLIFATAPEQRSVGANFGGVDGVFGLGLQWEGNRETPIPSSNSLMKALLDQQAIYRRVFSLNLQESDSHDGLVLLGGLDSKKYSGNLVKQRTIKGKNSDSCQHEGASACENGYVIPVKRITTTSPWHQPVTVADTPRGEPYLLDSSSTINFFSQTVIQRILEQFPGARPVEGLPLFEIDCQPRMIKGSIDFTIGDAVIKVPNRDFIWHIKPLPGRCFLPMMDSKEAGCNVLGQPFLSAAYVVIDQDNRDVYLGNKADCGSNEVALRPSDRIDRQFGECPESSGD